jgi:hypothetical protein
MYILKQIFLLLTITEYFLLGFFLPGRSIASENQAEIFLPVVFRNYVKGFNNPGFEIGDKAWIVQSNQGDGVVSSAAAYTGTSSAALGDGSSNRIVFISQQVKVPDSAYVVEYYQWMQSQETCPGSSALRVLVNSQPYQHYGICQDGGNDQWRAFKIYLAPYKGQIVDFRLEFTSTATSGNILYVDDFSFVRP